ncbi:Serine/threonine protein kinase [Handroanthus impetiginosus]|uniref:non-specific serine/threonine protein kinase n=1 Tax=Handroanthus impetiginosus TaxID=429701 RepID=A0A2G9H2X9_9LAMI|nr:Serine/threonine protein kinase [Handroanthus impetiginosus]
MPTGAQVAAYHVRPRRLSTTSISSSSSMITILLVLQLLSLYVLGAQENASEALLKFKSSLANADPPLADWNSSIPPCSGNNGNWVGVLCFNGYVWGLQLENMNLQGQIDVNSLVSLPFLRTLSFMNNNFEGTMPDWRKLGALKSLYLSNNQFSGPIREDAFKGMTSLKKVCMANNKFTGNIPTSLESPKLIELRLENNQFTGNIPAISSDHLKVFNVSNNQLEGPIPAPLSKMDASSFLGNKALCGKPLGSACDPPIPPPDLEPFIGDSPPSSPPTVAATTSEQKSPARMAIIIISVVLGLFLIILLLLIYRRSHNSQRPQLGREVSPSYDDEKSHVAVAAAAVVTSTNASEISGSSAKKGEQQPGKLSFVRDDRHKFDLQDLMRASAEVLGSGNFGASYKAVLVDGEALVVKRFKQMNNVAKEDFHEHMRRLGRLKHPNLLPLFAYLYRKEEKLLVFDYVYNGSLATNLHGKHSAEQPGLSWASRLKIIKGVAKGLAYLHNELPSLTVPHGHLKSSNVLLDNNFNPLLMDYTLGPVVNSSQVHQILVAYKSPEYEQTDRVCKKTDVWCFGILILETLTGKLVAKYLAQGCGQYGADLARWINAIVQEKSTNSTQVFDKEMEINNERCKPEMEKLLEIGIACCQENLDQRLDLEEALKQIEQVQEWSADDLRN